MAQKQAKTGQRQAKNRLKTQAKIARNSDFDERRDDLTVRRSIIFSRKFKRYWWITNRKTTEDRCKIDRKSV